MACHRVTGRVMVSQGVSQGQGLSQGVSQDHRVCHGVTGHVTGSQDHMVYHRVKGLVTGSQGVPQGVCSFHSTDMDTDRTQHGPRCR